MTRDSPTDDESTDSTTEYRFSGPRRRFHFPRWTKGCWRGRPGECCTVCSLRLYASTLRRGVATAISGGLRR